MMQEVNRLEKENDSITFIMMMQNWSKEEQQAALAVITGMNLQKKLDSQSEAKRA